ncbi:MAG TPA: hypothetical protein VME40_03605 [Caulobacteraceae bacterium]|nr:hypothetical protein [Caulobacteraceae bacterium]
MTARRGDVASPQRAPTPTAGMADFARAVFAGEDLTPAFEALKARAAVHPDDAGALLDLSTILQLVGQREAGLALQAEALSRQRWYRRLLGTGVGPRLLALVAPGDMMANTPVEFLLAGWSGVLDLMYLDPAEPWRDIPDHDVAILAVGESDDSQALLARRADTLARWPRPMINGELGAIAGLRRDEAAERLNGYPDVVAPSVRRALRADLVRLAAGDAPVSLGADIGYPIIARPVGSHAGSGLRKLDDAGQVRAYLAGQAAETFYVSPFIDYRSSDGRFRKLRVALVAGHPFVVHMAVSDHWMVHYLNAGMTADAAKRAEEAELMAGFNAGFAARHAAAFRTLFEAFGLDYFAIDCAEDRDGRLLVFEPDTAMIVHDMDPPDLFPYKRPAMRKLFAAFQALVNTLAEP